MMYDFSKLEFVVNPRTQHIQAGFIRPDGTFEPQADVTAKVVAAVAQHMAQSGFDYDTPQGKLSLIKG